MKKFVLPVILAVAPATAFAQDAGQGIFKIIQNLINIAVPIVFALAILFFLFNLAQFLLGAGEKKTDAKESMIWGIIILVVMFSVLGIVNIVQDTVGSDIDNNNIVTPNLDFRN